MSSTFDTFNDGYKFKYNHDGNIVFKYNNSCWKNVLLNNMLLNDYIHSQQVIPQVEITPIYDMDINQKILKYENNDNCMMDTFYNKGKFKNNKFIFSRKKISKILLLYM